MGSTLLMRSVVIATALSFALLLASFGNGPDVAPDWALVSADGETVRLSTEVKQQPAILFFWATWCPYCKALMPHLQSMRLEYGDDVKILAINFMDKGDPVAFIKDAGYDFTVLANGDAVAKLYGIYGTPGIIIVDSAQQIRFDLRDVPSKEPPATVNAKSHKAKAAYQTPYWAAEIRKGLDAVLQGPAR